MNAMQHAVRVLLVDDHAVVRAGYRRLLESTAHIRITAEAGDGESGYQAYTEQAFDVVVMDLTLPGISGFETSRRILQRDRAAKILVFSIHDEPGFVRRALDTGVLGYISKSSASDVLIEAVERVAAGESYLGDDVAARLTTSTINQHDLPLHVLSPREFEIFKMLAEGKSVNDIADILSLSVKTVANYNTQIKAKLEVSNATELVRIAIRHGVVGAG